eukprot:CAMPEP_0197913646 /NCGR_PEP_ID=MMETSP1439-20131203/76997_1 /TAXON_ID=66791 /ORGANISM="Gonyaulax spinifera, Strain CCMP409" /LENGTH=222 /DNA_ID=CAMNT_0043535517 /DNA_START=33 /DNA_END=698 /DNA_ORIENTATION=+
MPRHASSPPTSILVAVVALAFGPTTAAALVRKDFNEPTPDEAGLFGPHFRVPLLSVDNGATVAEVQMQLAITPQEQHHGLMFKRSLDKDTGMLFLYDTPEQRVLWMKNTYVPLDAAWFTTNAVMQEVQHLKPQDLTYRWSTSQDISMGLEMPGGWFESKKIAPGTVQLDRKALAAAIAQRGFKPAEFLGEGAGQTDAPAQQESSEASAAAPPAEAAATAAGR